MLVKKKWPIIWNGEIWLIGQLNQSKGNCHHATKSCVNFKCRVTNGRSDLKMETPLKWLRAQFDWWLLFWRSRSFNDCASGVVQLWLASSIRFSWWQCRLVMNAVASGTIQGSDCPPNRFQSDFNSISIGACFASVVSFKFGPSFQLIGRLWFSRLAFSMISKFK